MPTAYILNTAYQVGSCGNISDMYSRYTQSKSWQKYEMSSLRFSQFT